MLFKYPFLFTKEKQKLKNVIIPKTGDIIKLNYEQPYVNFLAKNKVVFFKTKIFIGLCIGVIKKGLASKILVRNVLKKQPIEFSLYIYSNLVYVAEVIDHKRKVRSSKVYFLRKKAGYYSKFRLKGILQKK